MVMGNGVLVKQEEEEDGEDWRGMINGRDPGETE